MKSFITANELRVGGTIVLGGTVHTIDDIAVTPKRGWIVATLGNGNKVRRHPLHVVKVEPEVYRG